MDKDAVRESVPLHRRRPPVLALAPDGGRPTRWSAEGSGDVRKVDPIGIFGAAGKAHRRRRTTRVHEKGELTAARIYRAFAVGHVRGAEVVRPDRTRGDRRR